MAEDWELAFTEIKGLVSTQTDDTKEIKRDVKTLIAKTIEQNGKLSSHKEKIVALERGQKDNRSLIIRVIFWLVSASAIAVTVGKLLAAR